MGFQWWTPRELKAIAKPPPTIFTTLQVNFRNHQAERHHHTTNSNEKYITPISPSLPQAIHSIIIKTRSCHSRILLRSRYRTAKLLIPALISSSKSKGTTLRVRHPVLNWTLTLPIANGSEPIANDPVTMPQARQNPRTSCRSPCAV